MVGNTERGPAAILDHEAVYLMAVVELPRPRRRRLGYRSHLRIRSQRHANHRRPKSPAA